jgi:serine/threonine protein kinase
LPIEPTHDDGFSQLEHAFDQALGMPAAERESFAQKVFAHDAVMLQQLRTLLAAHDSEQAASELHVIAARETEPSAGRRLGPYEVESLLGRGGMGAVYLAHRADGQYEKKVAIKIVDLPLATEAFFDRFRQERQILAGLDHPNIARLLDGGVSDEGILFLVMEYVEGTRIDTYCETHHLTVEAKLRLFIAVCGAVQFAHQNMVVHRDLKPDNVLVSEDGTPHLLDFGTAKLMSRDTTVETQGLTRAGFLSFTPEYASPEQVLGRPVATTSDTYSLGVLLYRMLTGRLPYQLHEATLEEMVRIICERPFDRATSTDNTFPNADLEAILGKALRKEADQRYQTAEQFATDVQAYLDHMPVLARKGNLRYRASKFVRRNRLALSFAAVLAVTVVAGLAGVLWQTHAARAAEHQSEASANELSRLSDSLLSELDDAIKQLPGSTGVQQVLVARVLEHLDRMSHDPHSGVVTQLSLVDAFVRLGNLQGNHYEQNLGDTPGALASLDKALAIAQPLAKAQPRDPAVLLALARAQDARGEILSFADDNAGAAASLDASSKTYDQLFTISTATPALLFEAGVVNDILGDVMGQDTGFADAEAALRSYHRAIDFDNRALAINPDFMPSRRGLVSMQMKIGNVEVETAPAAALTEFRGAIVKLNALPPTEQATVNLRRTRALLLRKQGLALAELGQYAEAAPLFDQSTAIYQAISNADAKDVRALRDIDRLLTNETFSYETAADPLLAEKGVSPKASIASAIKLEAERTDVLRRLVQMSPDDISVKQELAAVTVRMDALQTATAANVARDHEALDLLRKAAFDTRSAPSQLDLAFHAFAEANPTSLRDPSVALHCAQQGATLTHRKDPTWLLSLAQAYRTSGDVAQAKGAAQEGLALLPGDPSEQASRLHKLLDAEARQ